MPAPFSLNLGLLRLDPGGDILFQLNTSGCQSPVGVGLPIFEVNGALRDDFAFDRVAGERELPFGGKETVLRYTASAQPALELRVTVRSFLASPILRFKYALAVPPGAPPAAMTRSSGRDAITYFSLAQTGLDQAGLAEYQLSHFDPVAHSYLPLRLDRRPDEVIPGMRFVGPVALFHTSQQTLLAAFEHGADHPQSFFEFVVLPTPSLIPHPSPGGRGEQNASTIPPVSPGGTSRLPSPAGEGLGVREGLRVSLRAVKGNTFHGEPLPSDTPWESVWFELGLRAGPIDAFLPEYRRFFLDEVCENRQSRQPYIYYNTWNYQERQRYFKDRPYLESMTAERMLAEVDVAHRLGVDVFVIDTGWYLKTGDWLVNRQRFPEGLQEVRRKLEGYGMKLGLWFDPLLAALSSEIFKAHPEFEMTREGQPAWRGPVWETEESAALCLASDFAETFVETLVRLHRELGVAYFKWDGMQQYGCDSPLHHHGTQANSLEERREAYAYQMGLAMIHIVEQVARRCPEVIVDFDVTEGGRFVGLGFLSAGKYFLVNNGPYFSDFDIPKTVKVDPNTINVFFYPGAARPRVCRTGARFDELIPSILFLTHYLPDGPQLAQRNSLASLVLGGNGLWGDLLALSTGEVDFIAGQIALYKQVRAAVTRAYPRRQGFAGSSPEIHEKIDPAACAGLVAVFTVTPGSVTFYAQPLDLSRLDQVAGADAWEASEGGRLKITLNLDANDARVVFLLPNPQA